VGASWSGLGLKHDPEQVVDLRAAQPGDRCLHDPSARLEAARGIEVGHIFQLGRKYSAALEATFTTEAGVDEPLWMGCYGIGVSRLAQAAVEQIRDGMVVGLGSGSTAALMIQGLGARLQRGELRYITGVTTSFQGEVLAAELGIPLKSLNAISRIDLAIDGADEVDPSFQLIKGGGACHVQEKLVARRAERFVVVVDATKLVDTLNLGFLLPVEVLPGAWRQVQGELAELGGDAQLRMAVRKAGPVVTDQGNLVLDVKFSGGITDPQSLEREINNLPGVLENGLFVNLTDQVLVGEIVDGVPGVRDLVKR